jgi:mannitol/fructose-specific phosphotransferase system IIA component (Ntr-type)
MRLHRFLKEEMIDLHFDPLAAPRAEADRFDSERLQVEAEGEAEGDEEPTKKQLWEQKVHILGGLVGLLDRSGKITNPKKCLTDLRNREAKASTALGSGIALPHVRTPQAKGFCMAIAVAAEPGLYFDAIDEEPVRLFIPMVAPAYDDKFYLKVERALAAAFADGDGFRDAILEAQTPGEVIHLLSGIID